MSQIDNIALDQACEFYFTVTLTPVATAAASTVEQTFTLVNVPSKLKATDTIYVQDNAGPTNSVTMTHARANASGQLIIAYNNPTAGSLTYPAHSIVVAVVRLPVGTPAL